MREKVTLRTTDAPSDAVGIVEGLAAFLKNAFVYPDNNQRVRAGADEIAASIGAFRKATEPVVLRVSDDGLMVDAEPLRRTSVLLTWLREVFVTSRVGSVEFAPEVSAAAILTFARRLQAAHQERGAEFATRWEGPTMLGIAVREFKLAAAVVEPVEAKPAAPEVDPEQLQKNLVKTLAENSRVASELSALRRLLMRENAGDVVELTDLLAEVVRNLSAEAMRDPEYAAIVAERVLSSVRRAFLQSAAGVAPDSITPLLVDLGRKLFPRIGKNGPSVVSPASRGHDDDHITDDADALALELEEAEAWPEAIPSRTATCEQAEVVGIVLHILSSTDRMSAETLRDWLAKRTLSDEPGVRATICAYVDRALSEDERGGRPSRLQTVMRSLELRATIRTCGFLSPEGVASDFPRRIPLLVEMCTAEHAAQVLIDVARIKPAEQILAAETWFRCNRQVLSGSRVAQLLAKGGAACLPWAILALRYSSDDVRQHVAAYLRSVAEGNTMADPLGVADPNTRMPCEYLEPLAWHILRGDAPTDQLRTLAARALRHAAQELAGQESKLARRVACIAAFEELACDEAREYLKELVSARRKVLFRREPAAVRVAALEVLRSWKNR